MWYFFPYDYQMIIALQMSETDWEIQILDCHLENKIEKSFGEKASWMAFSSQSPISYAYSTAFSGTLY